MNWNKHEAASTGTTATWTATSVIMDVPSDADVISLGLYAKADDVKIRRVSVRRLGPSESAGRDFTKPLFSRNLLFYPRFTIQSEPMDLLDHESTGESIFLRNPARFRARDRSTRQTHSEILIVLCHLAHRKKRSGNAGFSAASRGAAISNGYG
jgi:hypothetical protein